MAAKGKLLVPTLILGHWEDCLTLVHEALNIEKRFCSYRTSENIVLVPTRTQEYLAVDKMVLMGARD